MFCISKVTSAGTFAMNFNKDMLVWHQVSRCVCHVFILHTVYRRHPLVYCF